MELHFSSESAFHARSCKKSSTEGSVKENED